VPFGSDTFPHFLVISIIGGMLRCYFANR